MRFASLVPCLLIVVGQGGCARFPEVDAATSEAAKSAPRPELVDVRPIVSASMAAEVTEATQQNVQARSKALQGRGAELAGPVLSQAELDALEERRARLRALSDATAEEVGRVAPDG